MSLSLLTYLGALNVCVWGIAHLFPTGKIVAGFGEISADNKRIITMEWIIEGAALIFIGVLVAGTTYTDGTSVLAKVMYGISVVMLNTMSVISVFTGARISHIAFRLCPYIFTGSSILILIGGLLQ